MSQPLDPKLDLSFERIVDVDQLLAYVRKEKI